MSPPRAPSRSFRPPSGLREGSAQSRPATRRDRSQEATSEQSIARTKQPEEGNEAWKGSIQRLEDRLGEMVKERNPLQRTFVQGTPFVQAIVNFPTPSKFKAPVVTPKYDGKTDPVLHIE